MSQVGTTVLLKLGTKFLVGESSLSFDSTQAMIEVSNKTSGNDAEFEAGRISRKISFSGVSSMTPSTTKYDFKSAIEAQEAGTPIAFEVTRYTGGTPTAVVGDVKISGNCLIAGVTWDSPDNDKNTFSLDIQVTGNVTIAANA